MTCYDRDRGRTSRLDAVGSVGTRPRPCHVAWPRGWPARPRQLRRARVPTGPCCPLGGQEAAVLVPLVPCPRRLVLWDCEAELSAFCTTASSRRPRSPWRTLLPSGVEGLGIALRRSAAAITFWLAVLKTGASPPWSSTMRRLTSRARRLAHSSLPEVGSSV